MRENGFPGRQTAAPAYGQVSVFETGAVTDAVVADFKAHIEALAQIAIAPGEEANRSG